MSRRSETLRESLSHVGNSTDFSYAIRNFLDRFKTNPDPALLADEPALISHFLGDGGYADAFAASAIFSSPPTRCRVHKP